MWFNNIQVLKYELDDTIDIENHLKDGALKPCPPHARFIYGWLPTIHQQFAHHVTGATLICMGKEERILPRGVINRQLEERLQKLELERGNPVKRSEKKQIAEDLEFELLPKAFCVQKRLYALLDTINQRLIINTSSTTAASQLTSLLRKTLPSLSLEPLDSHEHFARQLAQWITDPKSLPNTFQLASDCLLFSLDDKNKRFNCKGYELPSDEILTLLSQNLAAAEVSIIWNERIQFTLTDELTLKRLKCLDYLADSFQEISELESHEQQDASLALLAGELEGLLGDLFKETLTQSSKISTAACEVA